MTAPQVTDRISQKNLAGVYASVGDFRDALLSNMTCLFRLAYLLTGDKELAERCFVAGVDSCISATSVFREWASSWARRAIITNAIRMMSPRSGDHNNSLARENHPGAGSGFEDDPLRNVLWLKPFERVVFVISVLERFSDQECSLILSTSRGEVARARRSAFAHLAIL